MNSCIRQLARMLPLPAVRTGLCLTVVLALLAGCATPAVERSEALARSGDFESAYRLLEESARARPSDAAVRTALARGRDRVILAALSRAELALANGRMEEAERLMERVRQLDPANARLAGLEREAQAARDQRQAAQARQAKALAQAPLALPATALGPVFQKPVTLEFRDAQLTQVFEALARGTGVNFVFDKDVRADTRVTVFLRGVSLDEAVRVILATQQLDRKLLNDSTVLIYPNTPPKQREHQDLVTRSFYLVNTEATKVQALVRTMLKSRDLYVDERLNALVVRDTPEVIDLVQRLLGTLDVADPEVMLAVEILEVASDKVEELGISWPSQIQFGLPNVGGQVALNNSGFRASVANPAIVASLTGTTGGANLLANPTIRARNREKAKVQIGEKLPVFTTTSTANVGLSASVSYLDVGLKLEVEPSVQLDGEVIIKVGLEVSNLLREVQGPAGSLAYQVGTRSTTTSLRLRDGQTQVLAGLINDEDRRRATGVPELSNLPLVGRLFGVRDDTRSKTEIVMLITPRIVRNIELPGLEALTLPSGTETLPGARALRLSAGQQARVGTVSLGGSGGAPTRRSGSGDGAAPITAIGVVYVQATSEASVGETVSVTLRNPTTLAIQGELQFDTTRLQAASVRVEGGSLPFQLAANGEQAVVFRVLPGAAGSSVNVGVGSLSGSTAKGEPAQVVPEGEATIRVRPIPAPSGAAAPSAPAGVRP